MYCFRSEISLAGCLEEIQERAGVVMPTEDTDWCTLLRTEVTVRRDMVLQDALREGHKNRFKPEKCLKVQLHHSIYY